MTHARMMTLGLLAILALPLAAVAQDDEPFSAPNAVYFELGGNGLLYTFNYERRFRDHLAGRAGLMFFALEGTTSDGEEVDVEAVLVPLMINGLIGDGAGRFEIGAGPLIGYADASARDIEGTEIDVEGFGFAGVTSTLGYRYHPQDGGFLFRVGLTPFISGSPQIWGGISIGYVF